MKVINKIKRSTLLIVLIVSGTFLLVKCISSNDETKEKEKNNNFKSFAGSAVCANCHKDIYDQHIHTEHHLTSAAVTEENILGSFVKGKNVFAFDMFNYVQMEKRDSGFYQVYYNSGNVIKEARFDIVVGSGRKGQSYLNWRDDRLVQLPITYFSPAGQWSNSPGYPPQKVVFNRPITSRCMECHSTYLEKTSDASTSPESFDRNHIIFGVECEKCHGPAARHVDFQSQNPDVKEARFIVNPGKLSRERIMDLCALCHGGRLTKTRPSFTFQAGDTLSNYFTFNPVPPDANAIDVHGNQLGLLSFSKCYTQSDMTCMSCHNIHENENGKIELFSQRCQNCHSEGHEKLCKMTNDIGHAITQNCIDCHMPKQPSHAVAVYLQGAFTPTPALMRTHYIKVYPEEVKKVREFMKQPKATTTSSK
jgi:hypothetical protein